MKVEFLIEGDFDGTARRDTIEAFLVHSEEVKPLIMKRMSDRTNMTFPTDDTLVRSSFPYISNTFVINLSPRIPLEVKEKIRQDFVQKQEEVNTMWIAKFFDWVGRRVVGEKAYNEINEKTTEEMIDKEMGQFLNLFERSLIDCTVATLAPYIMERHPHAMLSIVLPEGSARVALSSLMAKDAPKPKM